MKFSSAAPMPSGATVVAGMRSAAQLIEAMQAQVVRPPLHVGRLEGDAERVAQHRKVLEVDLFLKVLGAG